MVNYTEKSFNIPSLQGISEKQLAEHLKLYAGYVKHTNLIAAKIAQLSQNEEENTYIINELRRRLGFEWDGMRMHEYYFHSLEDGPKPLDENSVLGKKMIEQYGDFDGFLSECIKVAGTRGVGWAVLYFDSANGSFLLKWVDEHSLGHLAGLQIVLVIDVWEHAYMVDYVPSEKLEYVKKYLSNINWQIVAEDFQSMTHAS